jgi:hypothetical protein
MIVFTEYVCFRPVMLGKPHYSIDTQDRSS